MRFCGPPWSLQLRTCNSCGTTLLSAVEPGVEGMRKPETPSHFPREKVSRELVAPLPPPHAAARGGCEGGRMLPGTWRVSLSE